MPRGHRSHRSHGIRHNVGHSHFSHTSHASHSIGRSYGGTGTRTNAATSQSCVSLGSLLIPLLGGMFSVIAPFVLLMLVAFGSGSGLAWLTSSNPTNIYTYPLGNDAPVTTRIGIQISEVSFYRGSISDTPLKTLSLSSYVDGLCPKVEADTCDGWKDARDDLETLEIHVIIAAVSGFFMLFSWLMTFVVTCAAACTTETGKSKKENKRLYQRIVYPTAIVAVSQLVTSITMITTGSIASSISTQKLEDGGGSSSTSSMFRGGDKGTLAIVAGCVWFHILKSSIEFIHLRTKFHDVCRI
jgi:hypothetical protein